MGKISQQLSLMKLKRVVAGVGLDDHAGVRSSLSSMICMDVEANERREVFQIAFTRAQEGANALHLNAQEAIKLFGGPPKSSLRRWKRLAKQETPFLVNRRFGYALVNFAVIWVAAVRQFGTPENASAWMKCLGVIKGKAGRTPLALLQEGGPESYRVVRAALRVLKR